MELIGTVLTIIFVALVLGAALTFGMVLIVWFMGVAALIAFMTMVRAAWLRWRFLQAADHRPTPPPGVIEGEYKDISNEK